jgi:hypothetical protein
LAAPEQQYSYDVFVSYSHKDKQWVHDKLLPRLKNAGLRVCIDSESYGPGEPFGVGIPLDQAVEQAIATSRKTLCVFTPAYRKSEWCGLEQSIITASDPDARRRRLLPVLLQHCDLPAGIRRLLRVDFSRAGALDQEWNKLLAALGKWPPEIRTEAERPAESGTPARARPPFRSLIAILPALKGHVAPRDLIQAIGSLVVKIVSRWGWVLVVAVIVGLFVSGLSGQGPLAGLFLRPTATATLTAMATSRPTYTLTGTATATGIPTVTTVRGPTTTLEPTLTATAPVKPTPTATETATPMPDAWVSEATAELREGPSSVYPVLKSLGQGTELVVLGRSAGKEWLKVVAPDSQVGWVRIEFLHVNVAVDGLEVGSAPPSPTPRVSATSTLTPTPTGMPYPAPVLLEPGPGGSQGTDVSASSPFTFQWTWAGTLGPDEYFDLQLECSRGCSDTEWAGIAWTKELTFHSDNFTVLQSRGASLVKPYYIWTEWRVQVIRGREGRVEAVLSPPSLPEMIVVQGY